MTRRGTKRKEISPSSSTATTSDIQSEALNELLEEQATKKRRLARKAELARNTRRKQKDKMLSLERDHQRLSAEVAKLRQEKQAAVDALDKLISSPCSIEAATRIGDNFLVLIETLSRHTNHVWESISPAQLFRAQNVCLDISCRIGHTLRDRLVKENDLPFELETAAAAAAAVGGDVQAIGIVEPDSSQENGHGMPMEVQQSSPSSNPPPLAGEDVDTSPPAPPQIEPLVVNGARLSRRSPRRA
eukprot:GABV01000859.1.p1 GENE.GABV01000859.1~~GABV01000859.1.p1  ORF type:complete len:245 (-),score=76.33 GABV01000859.1:206-940(-)